MTFCLLIFFNFQVILVHNCFICMQHVHYAILPSISCFKLKKIKQISHLKIMVVRIFSFLIKVNTDEKKIPLLCSNVRILYG